MIRIPNNETVDSEDNIRVHSLDQLVESLCKSYSIPSSMVDEMRSGLEDSLSTYLNEFLSKNSCNINSTKTLDINENLGSILDNIRMHNSVTLYDDQIPLIEFINNPDGISYRFLELDTNSVPTDLLVESWNCQDAKELSPLITYILYNSVRKESE